MKKKGEREASEWKLGLIAGGKRELRRESEARVERMGVLWGELRPRDYDFGSWAKNTREEQLQADKERARAGCIYEYARESAKLRGLLALVKSAFEELASAEKAQGRSPF